MRCRMQHNLSRIARWFVYGLCIVSFAHCGRVTNHVVCCDVNVREWDESVEIVYENQTPQTMYDMDIVLHVNRTFQEKDVEFEIILTSPDSLRYSECIKAPASIDWGLAECFTDVSIKYRRDVTFLREGEYLVAIRPLKQMKGVESVGINFRKK